jgi:hypothetical protein
VYIVGIRRKRVEEMAIQEPVSRTALSSKALATLALAVRDILAVLG